MKVKLCGFTEEESLQTAIDEKCDFIGFIFHKNSPRYVTIEKARNLAEKIPQNIAKVAVTVDAEFEFLEEIFQNLQPQFFQFHGKEDISYLQKFREIFPNTKIIKAFKISTKEDLETLHNYENYADFLMLDSRNAGSGESFDWNLLQNFNSTKPWFLSGGLNVQNIENAIATTNATMVDISSGIEEIRGVKSSKLVVEFMQKIREIC